MRYDLDCRYDSRNSFYGKAVVKVIKNSIEQEQLLYSYETLVASIITDFEKGTKVYELIPYVVNGKTKTQTTTRHQKEFFKQNCLTDEEIKEIFKKGKLEVNYEL